MLRSKVYPGGEERRRRPSPVMLSNYCPNGCYADLQDGGFQRFSVCAECGERLRLRRYVKATGLWAEIG